MYDIPNALIFFTRTQIIIKMVKKVDSQKTKDDSNECDLKAAEMRRNAQLIKA